MFSAAMSILNWGMGGYGPSNNGTDRSSNSSSNNDGNSDDDGRDDDDGDDGRGHADSNGDGYLPTYADVFVVKAMLGRIGNLPLELVDDIIDCAEYWPHTHVNVASTRLGDITVPSRSFSTSNNNMFVCRTPPLGFMHAPAHDDEAAVQYSRARHAPKPLPNPDPAHPGHDAACLPDTIQTWLPAQQMTPVEHPCRKIVFTIVSRDQGWSNNINDRGSYRGSYSWFDVGLERYGKPAPEAGSDNDDHPSASSAHGFPPGVELYSISPEVVEVDPSSTPDGASYAHVFPLLPDASRLQSNRVATRELTTHKIVWSWTDNVGTTVRGNVRDGASNDTDGTDGEEEPEEHPLEKIGRGAATGDGKFVRSLCIGDVVTVWAKARFPGWANNIQSIDVDVYWVV